MTNQLKLRINQDYNGGYTCTDENYDGAPDAGRQNIGSGKTQIEALTDYMQDLNDYEVLDPSIDYIISGKDLI